MVQIDDYPVSTEEFDTFFLLPENVSRDFELIGGEIREKTVSRFKDSVIAANFGFRIILFSEESGYKVHFTGADGGYVVGDDRYIPDGAFISSTRQPELVDAYYNPDYPDLAVEVISPSDRQRDISIKLSNYLAAGTVVWQVYPDDKIIQVHVSGQRVRKFRSGDTLDGGDVLPGFRVAVDKLFDV